MSINIFTKSKDSLGQFLTNPSYAKNNKSDFDIHPFSKNPITKENWIHPRNYFLSKKDFAWVYDIYNIQKTAENIWGSSVESWYFANIKDDYTQLQKEIIMEELILCKFKTYLFLIEEIEKRGGYDFLRECSHVVFGHSKWEGIGLKSNFIRVMCRAYVRLRKLEPEKSKILKELERKEQAKQEEMF